MNTKEIYKQTILLETEKEKLEELLDKLDNKKIEMMKLCSHDLVFKYKDNYPRMMCIDGYYFCPACEKIIKSFNKDKMKETQFKNSKIIPLTNLSLFGSKEVHNEIKNEVFNNYDYYYDDKKSIEEISSKMESVLEGKQIKYESPEKTLKKMKRFEDYDE